MRPAALAALCPVVRMSVGSSSDVAAQVEQLPDIMKNRTAKAKATVVVLGADPLRHPSSKQAAPPRKYAENWVATLPNLSMMSVETTSPNNSADPLMKSAL
mmetsp:Transcript_9614/g.26163  ORF Transcript_9614/g.26163 Transcript_9614/m.26163 type:complete len:101 (-) Transcript_9614:356-658(-)